MAHTTRVLWRRIVALIARGQLLRIDDDGPRQIHQARVAGQPVDQLERFGAYGFTSRAHPGASEVVLWPEGSRDVGYVVGIEDTRYRLRGLEHGEVALYDDLGTVVHLKRGGVVVVKAAARVELEAPVVKVVGDLEVTGDVRAAGDIGDGVGTLQDARDTFNLHTHRENGDGGGVTDPPLPPMGNP